VFKQSPTHRKSSHYAPEVQECVNALALGGTTPGLDNTIGLITDRLDEDLGQATS